MRHKQEKSRPSATLLASLLLAVLVAACLPTEPPEEPQGKAVEFTEAKFAPGFPDAMKESVSWHRQGNYQLVLGRPQEALYCFNQAQGTYPTEEPDFAGDVLWERREWSGHPIMTYLSKAVIYARLYEATLALHYIELAEKHAEHPSDLVMITKARAVLAFTQSRYQDTVRLLAQDSSLYSRLLLAAARVNLGEKQAKAELIGAWRETERLSPPTKSSTRAFLPETAYTLGESTFMEWQNSLK